VKQGQAYNLNIEGSDILAPDGRGNWHGCPKCYTRPKTNGAFWDRKREANMARDRRVTRELRGRGWKVIHLWQLPSLSTLRSGISWSPKRPICLRVISPSHGCGFAPVVHVVDLQRLPTPGIRLAGKGDGR
jgi:hypothetical protein